MVCPWLVSIEQQQSSIIYFHALTIFIGPTGYVQSAPTKGIYIYTQAYWKPHAIHHSLCYDLRQSCICVWIILIMNGLGVNHFCDTCVTHYTLPPTSSIYIKIKSSNKEITQPMIQHVSLFMLISLFITISLYWEIKQAKLVIPNHIHSDPSYVKGKRYVIGRCCRVIPKLSHRDFGKSM